MFENCKSLQSLKLNFNSQNFIDRDFMFYNCNSLISLNLTNVNAKNAINNRLMFINCNSLIYKFIQQFK